jgi:hypothetical protein
MISSTPRLKERVEFVTKAIITLSSTPDSASLTSSASAPVSLILAGRGFSVEIGLASDSASFSSAACISLAASSSAGVRAGTSASSSASRAEGSVFVA